MTQQLRAAGALSAAIAALIMVLGVPLALLLLLDPSSEASCGGRRRSGPRERAGAASPMQIGIGGAATDNWDTIVGVSGEERAAGELVGDPRCWLPARTGAAGVMRRSVFENFESRGPRGGGARWIRESHRH